MEQMQVGGEQSAAAPISLFDDRYGTGAHDRLLGLLRQPCITFAAIAGQFGVSRERVRQWHAAYLPDAPKGLERRRLCQLHQARRRLLTDALFKPFYSHAREAFPAEQIGLIRARDGLRARSARVGGATVVIKKARRRLARREGGATAYVLSACRRAADFVYFHLDEVNFLCVPFRELPLSGTTYLDVSGSKYQQYRNTFAAITRGEGEAISA